MHRDLEIDDRGAVDRLERPDPQARAGRCDTAAEDDSWIDVDRDEFSLDPSAQLPRLYARYRDA